MRVQQGGSQVGMRRLCWAVLTREEACAAASQLGHWEHAPFHQVGMGRREFLLPLPPHDISTCV